MPPPTTALTTFVPSGMTRCIPPAEVKKRVYIIDEVHMLSISAFNALLKTIEEPPGAFDVYPGHHGAQ